MSSLGMEPSTTKHERIEFAALGHVEILHEVVADFVGEHRVVQVNLGDAGNGSQQYIFKAGLLGGSYGNRIAVTA